MTPDALKESIKLGAVSFLPKEMMAELDTYLADVITQLPGTPEKQLDTLLPDQWILSHPEAVLPDQNWKPPRDNVLT